MVLMCWEKILLMLQVLAYFWRIFPELRIGFFPFPYNSFGFVGYFCSILDYIESKYRTISSWELRAMPLPSRCSCLAFSILDASSGEMLKSSSLIGMMA